MQPFDVVAYTFHADIYCPEHCLERLLKDEGLEGHGLSLIPTEAIERLGVSRFGGEKYDDGEHNWDSDEFPKVVFRDQLEAGEHCCAGHSLESED